MGGDTDYLYPELQYFTLSGELSIKGDAAYLSTVEPDLSKINRVDDTFTYEWLIDDVIVGTGVSYILTASDVGKTLQCKVVSTKNYNVGTLYSDGVVVSKAVQPATPVIPQALLVTDNNAIFSTAVGQEYSLDGENWQSGGTFADLLPNHTYTVYVRIAETAVYLVGDTVEAMTVTTDRRPIVGSVAIMGEGRYGETLQADVSGITTADATLKYEWLCGDTLLGTGTTYTIVKDDLYQDITLRVSGTGDYTGTLISNTVTGKKAENTTAAPTPVALNKTGDTITLVVVPGCEYSIDRVNWNTTATFTDLQAVHTYTVYQRYAATETHNAGPISEGVRVTTTKDQVSAPAAPQLKSATEEK